MQDIKKLLLLVPLMLCQYSSAKDHDISVKEAVTRQATTQQSDHVDKKDEYQTPPGLTPLYINKIEIEGTTNVSHLAIRNRIPYRTGDKFDPAKTRTLIKNLYSLGDFSQIKIVGQAVGHDKINLIVKLTSDKIKVEKFVYKGNKSLTEATINKNQHFDGIKTISDKELNLLIRKLKKEYRELNFHNPEITAAMEVKDNRATVTFDIIEGIRSYIKKVRFTGNKHLTSKLLRGKIFTREDWILGFTNGAGSYKPEAVEMDRHIIENVYQSSGYMNARVTEAKIDIDPKTKQINVTFDIDEGNRFTVSKISAPGNDLKSEEELLNRIPIHVGNYYSKEAIRDAMERLRIVWGEFGYIYADINPIVIPNPETKTVSITLQSELGQKMRLKRINIKGNKKTRDKVIRRKVTMYEGETITTQKMERSKERIHALGYFDMNQGVSWRIRRISDGMADLDLNLKEVKTGKFNISAGFGGSPKDITSTIKSLYVNGMVAESNLFGSGINVAANGGLGKEQRHLSLSVSDPWLLDRPMSGTAEFYHRNSSYDEIHSTTKQPDEKLTGLNLSLGYIAPSLGYTQVNGQLCVERIDYKDAPLSSLSGTDAIYKSLYQTLLDRRFKKGDTLSLSGTLSQDLRNHPMHPSRGYHWHLTSRIALPVTKNSFKFVKCEGMAVWYTPLINEYDLIFAMRAFGGITVPYSNSNLPYRELYHIGGPASVRGYVFGQVGPSAFNDSLGAKKAFYINNELQFRITQDMNMRGVIFYDGGAGWDTPDASVLPESVLKNNRFSYRHSVGFGIRLERPTPVKIDWGFKLNRNKKRGEKVSEVNFTALGTF